MFSVANDALKKVLKAAYNANQEDLEPGALENEVQVNVQESPQISSPQSQITSPDPGVLGDISQIQCPFRCSTPQIQSSSSPIYTTPQRLITSPEPGVLEGSSSPICTTPQRQITSPDPGVLGDISHIQCPFRCSTPQIQSSSSPICTTPQRQITSPDPGVLGDIPQIQCPFRCSTPQIQSSSSPICTTPQRQITSPDPGVLGGLVDNKEPAVLRRSCRKRRLKMNSDFVYEMRKNWNRQDLGVLEETDNSPKLTSSTQEPQSRISSPLVLRRSCRRRRSNRQEDFVYTDKKKHKFSQ